MDAFHPLELGALRSNISLTLHTFHAALIWRGRTARPGARPILGMAGYIQVTNRLKQAAARDDPYADWAMCQLEAKLESAKASIGELIQHLKRIHEDRPGQVYVGENLNQHPVILPLFIGSQLGFLGVYLLTDYDVLARRALLAHHTALITQQDMARILDSGGRQLRGLFDLAQRCKPSGLSREDFQANHAEAQAVRARLGALPEDILSGVRRSQYAPSIVRARASPITNLHPGESAT
ncbi:PFL_4669 family integrating conjugative element protein [Pseudomonas sp. B392_1p]|uniref:PFL_4669 family integrating conjugative element protein n=1 Tax=Pseudomonas sp. B392_1p TaxID=3457507 RepID=UPI003FCF7532